MRVCTAYGEHQTKVLARKPRRRRLPDAVSCATTATGFWCVAPSPRTRRWCSRASRKFKLLGHEAPRRTVEKLRAMRTGMRSRARASITRLRGRGVIKNFWRDSFLQVRVVHGELLHLRFARRTIAVRTTRPALSTRGCNPSNVGRVYIPVARLKFRRKSDTPRRAVTRFLRCFF